MREVCLARVDSQRKTIHARRKTFRLDSTTVNYRLGSANTACRPLITLGSNTPLFCVTIGINMENRAYKSVSQIRAIRRARQVFSIWLAAGLLVSPAFSQQPGTQANPPQTKPAPQAGKPAPAAGKPKPNASQLSDKEKRQEKAREIFADAANAQNNGAYPLAIEQWSKLLKEYPTDPLASSARHFLGVCYLQQEKPNFSSAIEQFRISLQDAESKQREESLVNLGWSLYQEGIVSAGDSRKQMLGESAKVLAALVEKYPDSSHADKAMFYAGESEARLGNLDKAISLYNQLLQNRALENSSVRPDALFGLAVTYDEQQQPKLAKENYDLFLAKYAGNALSKEVRLRSAEIAIKDDQIDQAVQLLEQVVSAKDFEKSTGADYALYRYGFALAKSGKFNESAEVYQRLSTLFPNSQYSQNSSLAAGQTLMRDKKFDEAFKAFERLLAGKDDRASEASHWMCQIVIVQNKPSEAIAIARKALEWGSKSPSAALLKMDLADGLSATPEGKVEARTLYEQIAVENAEDAMAPRATYNAAFAALQVGALADAQRWSEAFAKRFPNDPLASDVAYIRAESTLQLGQHESAATAFEQLITAEPKNPMRSSWETRLAAARYLGGQYEKALELTTKAIKEKQEPTALAESLFLQGASLLKLEKLEQAIKALQKSNQTDAKWGQADEVLVILAEAQNALGKKEEAKLTLQKILKEYPNSRFKPQVEFRLGQILSSMNDFDRAIIAYDSVLNSSKDKSLIEYSSYGKAFILIQKEQYGPALQLLEPIASDTREDGVGYEARVAKAICLRQLGKPKDAVQVLKQLLNTKLPAEQKPKALYELGLAYSALEQVGLAIESFESLIASHPQFAMLDKAYYELAWAYKSQKSLEKANEIFQTMAAKYPESPLAAEAFFHVGQAEYDNSKYDRAIKAYTVAATRSVDANLQEKSLYKLGWAFFQQKQYDQAIEQFKKQSKEFPKGTLSIDSSFMIAECLLKQEKYADAWPQYESTRRGIEAFVDPNGVSDQVTALVYLHGAQAARELKKWSEVESWIDAMNKKVPSSPFLPMAKYELAYARQNLKRTTEAVQLYSEVAEEQRNEIGARSRFMMGEVFFADREFAKAISEFQKVMYGYGGTQAPDDIKNWQVRSAIEAGRCSEVLIADQKGDKKKKAVDIARKFYEFVVNNHENHPWSKQAKERLSELSKL